MATGVPSGSTASVLAIRRHPVKSMRGEDVETCTVTVDGVIGDRSYALVDESDGKVASAKNPRKWPDLFAYGAELARQPRTAGDLPEVRIALPDGSEAFSGDPDVHDRLSAALGREVRLERRAREVARDAAPGSGALRLEEYWPDDVEGLAHSGIVTEEAMPEGTFFDCAVVHLVTTASLEALRRAHPQGQFDVRRFRPNFVMQTDDAVGFVENDWVGRTLVVGGSVHLRITGRCPRCVMTTLPQGDLPKDSGILRAAALHNGAHVGVYASVECGGRVRRGDAVRVL